MPIDVNWLRQRFTGPGVPPVVEGDGRVLGEVRGAGLDPATLMSAAVLVPVIAHPERLTVLLTRRTEHLKHHPGQISFPGGRAELDDDSIAATALREAWEEVGLDPATVEVIGTLSDYSTVSGYRVTPVVGLVQPPKGSKGLRADPFEVAEIFEVPLEHLLDPANHQQNTMMFGGQTRRYYAIPFGLHYIWGATAGMLMNLYRHLIREPEQRG